MREIDKNVGNVENPRLKRLLPRESQQLPHEIGSPVRILLDLHDIRKRGIPRLKAQQQEIAESDHCGEKVIEVVRHPPGELPYGLHLLRLDKLDLKIFLLGNVDEMKAHAPSGTALG